MKYPDRFIPQIIVHPIRGYPHNMWKGTANFAQGFCRSFALSQLDMTTMIILCTSCARASFDSNVNFPETILRFKARAISPSQK